MKKTALVTGSSRGIGLAFCQELHSRGWQVIATCRQPSALDPYPFYKKLQLTVDDDGSIEALRKELAGHPINLLINNAGIYSRHDGRLEELDRAALIREFDVDTVSPMMVSKALLPNLLATKGSIINISSLLGSIGDASSVKGYGYRSAKAALNMMTKVLSLEMKEKLEFVVAFHPGMVATDMLGGPREGAISAEESVKAMLDSFEALKPEQNGCFLSRKGNIEPY